MENKFIDEYRKAHGNKYDYSLVDLREKKIKIICPIHGLFEQNKFSHKKYGCWRCSVEYRASIQSLGKDDFVKKSVGIHGDKYDYSLVKYKNNNTKVEIICPIHGLFGQTPGSHMSGNGCSKCGTTSMASKQSYDTEKFIEKSKKIHGDRYDYSLSKYINNHTMIDIICQKHGSFKQSPQNHMTGQGCPKCVGKSLTKEEILDRFKNKHGDKYDYTNFTYSTEEKIEIICKKHGVFKQKISNHLFGQGCPKCVGLKKNTSDFIDECINIHGNIYNYSKTEYKSAKEKVIIICQKHGEFKQAPTHHLSGQDCPKCKCSKGEKKVNNILLENNINFIHHYEFPDLKDHEFDFFIPDKNICIEYDGVQHFRPVAFFGGKNTFDVQKERDRIKDEYCLLKNITLIRIAYFDNIMEKIKSVL